MEEHIQVDSEASLRSEPCVLDGERGGGFGVTEAGALTEFTEYVPGTRTPRFTPTLPGHTSAEVAGETGPFEPGVNFCPDQAKVANVTIKSPLLPSNQPLTARRVSRLPPELPRLPAGKPVRLAAGDVHRRRRPCLPGLSSSSRAGSNWAASRVWKASRPARSAGSSKTTRNWPSKMRKSISSAANAPRWRPPRTAAHTRRTHRSRRGRHVPEGPHPLAVGLPVALRNHQRPERGTVSRSEPAVQPIDDLRYDE